MGHTEDLLSIFHKCCSVLDRVGDGGSGAGCGGGGGEASPIHSLRPSRPPSLPLSSSPQPILQRLFYLICAVLAVLAQGLRGLFMDLVPAKLVITCQFSPSQGPSTAVCLSWTIQIQTGMAVREEQEPWEQVNTYTEAKHRPLWHHSLCTPRLFSP